MDAKRETLYEKDNLKTLTYLRNLIILSPFVLRSEIKENKRYLSDNSFNSTIKGNIFTMKLYNTEREF